MKDSWVKSFHLYVVLRISCPVVREEREKREGKSEKVDRKETSVKLRERQRALIL